MSVDPPTPLSASQRVLRALQEAQSRIALLERARTEPIAVIGLSCRFPGGADNPEEFWRLLRDGVDAISEVPSDRWDVGAFYDPDPESPGKMYCRSGGFVERVDQFDPHFFGIAPREAESIDPQQRLLLEVAWEAFENAGQTREKLRGSATSVFVGITTSDYARRLVAAEDFQQIDAYFNTGNALNAAAGRLSYAFALQGPSLAIDTACSSALVAVHQACQSLRLGECLLALAGAVNLILSPENSIAASKSRMLSPDGRCKTFAASADGYGRGEGCGLVILKRLSDAIAAGDAILAVLRGSAVNQDGPSGGLTVPNGPAQQALIETALANAGVTPEAVRYVEAHGTGTPLGDPIELRALAGVHARRTGAPLLVGSVKTNIGHLESASGMAGLIKVILALQHGQIPPHLHFAQPNPHIPWADIPLRIPTSLTPWPGGGARRIAGVSSFGGSGTNAHLIVEEPPAPATAPSADQCERPIQLLKLSARTSGALKSYARRLADWIEEHPEARLEDVAFSANTGRSDFVCRAGVLAGEKAEAQLKLAALAAGAETLGSCSGTVEGTPKPRIAFLFTGEENLHGGINRELYDGSPVFRAALDRCHDLLEESLTVPLLDLLFPKKGEALRLEENASRKAAVFAFQFALAALWKSWGIEPGAVLGDGAGEYAAAAIAGVFSLEDALQLVAPRGQVGLLAKEISFCAPGIPLLSTRSGAIADADVATPDYWTQQVEAPSRLSAGLDALRRLGCNVFLEVGPQTLLTETERAALTGRGETWLASLHEPGRDWATMCEGLGRLYVLGAPVDWDGFERGDSRRRVVLPNYPFQRQRCWLKTPARQSQGLARQSHELAAGRPSKDGFRRDWLYQVKWRRAFESSTLGSPLFPSAREIGQKVKLDLETLASQAAVNYSGLLGELERLSGDYVVSAFRTLGWNFVPGARLTSGMLAGQWRVVERQQGLLERLLDMLEEAGIVERIEAHEWIVRTELPEATAASRWDDLSRRYPQARLELVMLDRCGSRLAEVLRGNCNPLELLFPGDDSVSAADLYRDSPGAKLMNRLLQKTVARALEFFPRDRRLRVLEIGAGTGGTTAAVLPILPAGQTDYLFTDLSPAFLARARERFADYPFLRYEALNIEQAAAAQGFQGRRFDLILAANVLHATRSMVETMGHVRELLEPGGLLIVLEATRPLRWSDLIFGLTDGWWRFADHELRPAHPLLSPEQWPPLLCAAGFSEPVVLTADRDEVEVCSRLSVIVTQAGTAPAKMKAAPARTWLLFSDRRGTGSRLARLLLEAGESSILVFPGEGYRQVAGREFEINPGERAQFHDLWSELTRRHGAFAGVVHLWNLDLPGDDDLPDEKLAESSVLGCGSLLHVSQTLSEAGLEKPPALWIVTRGAAAVEARQSPAVAQALAVGLAKVIAKEHPEFCPRLVDLDPAVTSDSEALLCEEIRRSVVSGHSELAFRNGHRWLARLERFAPSPPPSRPRMRSEGTYLITGGLGGIGLSMAAWLVEQGVRSLLLVGRSEPSAGALDRIEGFKAAGATVTTLAADVSQRDQVGRLLDFIQERLPPLRGIIHAAGVFDDRLLREHRWELFAKVFAPKIHGAWLLHSLTRHLPLDLFLLCSSVSALFGGAGMGNYVAANAFLDALASHRRGLGLPALSINWGLWDQVGMAAAVGARREAQYANYGMVPMKPREALRALAAVLDAAPAQAAIMDVDWRKFLETAGSGAASGFCDTVRPERVRAEVVHPDATDAEPVRPMEVMAPDFRQVLNAAPAAARRALLAGHVRLELARVLGLNPAHPISPKQGFFEMGMDSLTSVELRNRLQNSLSCALSSTLTFKYPTLEELVEFLAGELLGASPDQRAPENSKDASDAAAWVNGELAEADGEGMSAEELTILLDEKLASVEKLMKSGE